MKGFLYAIDPPEKDSIESRISKESIVSKYWLHLSASMGLLWATIVVLFMSIQMGDIKPAKTFEVNTSTGKPVAKQIRTLPYPQESPRHRMAWATEAVMKVYTFDFLNVGRKLRESAYYFTPDSHKLFVETMNKSLVDRIRNDKLEVSLVPLTDPILISVQDRGENRIWHYRIPVLVSYYGGVNVVSEKKKVELKVVRSPIHKNPKGLEILSFVITAAN